MLGRNAFSSEMELALVEACNENRLKKCKKIKLKKYQRVDMYVFDVQILNSILEEMEFKDIGNIYDYKKLPKVDSVNGNGVMDYKLFNRLAVSKKYKTIMLFNKRDWYINVMFIVSSKRLKEFTEISSKLVMENDGTNSLKGFDLTSEPGVYVEINDSWKDETKKYEITKKRVENEHLVFDKESTINKVKNSILKFFEPETEEMYKKLEIPYKRGNILYGPPGNGKSAMIRELIRIAPPDVTKIIIKKVSDIVDVLSSLPSALNGQKALIFLEDMETNITERNRSDFLNALDGVEIKTGGMFIIGTTNHLEKIDNAFRDRAGRFDQTYLIDNPNESMRRLFFKSRHLRDIFENIRFNKKHYGTEKDIVEEFTKASDGLSLTNLKEIITRVSYALAYNEYPNIKDAINGIKDEMFKTMKEHDKLNSDYEFKRYQESSNGIIMRGPVKETVNVVQFTEVKEKKKKKLKLERTKKERTLKLSRSKCS